MIALALATLLAGAAPTGAPADPPEPAALAPLSLEDLLDLETGVASGPQRPLREAPGIVTVLTREEMRARGLRDLADVLELVPGFQLGVDVENAVGPGMRGLWAQEGKVLLLLDGQVLNDPFYDSLALGNRYPVDLLDRVEIIRGPGSAVHGGHAQLAVVHLVTRGPRQLEGAFASGGYGQMSRGLGARTLSLQLGRSWLSGDVAVGASVHLGEGRRSDRVYRDFAGSSFEMASGSRTDPLLVDVGVEVRDLSVRLVHERYVLGMRDGGGEVIPPVKGSMESTLGEVSYRIRPASGVVLTPRLTFRRELPWRVTDASSSEFFDKTALFLGAGLAASWQPREGVDLLAGVEGGWARGTMNDARPLGYQQPFFGDRLTIDRRSSAAYAQLLVDSALANLAAGARLEKDEGLGPSFVPRLALTRVLGPVHAKLLWARAFRSPGLENVSQGAVQAERTTVWEAEVGTQLGTHLFAAVNAFDVTVERPIVYVNDPVRVREGYFNFDRTGSRGVELDARWRAAGAELDATWSFYGLAGKNRIDAYAVPGHPQLAQAFAAHKVTLSGVLPLAARLTLAPTLLVTSDRWAYLRGDAAGQGVLANAGPLARLDLFLRHRDAWVRGLDAGLGVHNALDARDDFLRPYPGHAPLPGRSREVYVTLSYEWSRVGR